MIRRLITVKDKHVICLKYEDSDEVTLGADKAFRELVYRIYLYAFDEQAGPLDFYEVTRGKARITFKCDMRSLSIAIQKMEDMGYELEDTTTFNRLM